MFSRRRYVRYGLSALAGALLLGAGVSAWWYTKAVLPWDVYTSSSEPFFSVRYFQGMIVEKDYINPLLPAESGVRGVAFSFPPEWLGANGVVGGSLTVEYSDTVSCSAHSFLPAATMTRSVTENGVTYSVASGSYGDPSAFSSETVYALVGSTPCMAVEYKLQTDIRAGFDPHSPATVERPSAAALDFTEDKAYGIFDAMRRSLTWKTK